MEDFGTITLELLTDLPTTTDVDLEARYEEFVGFRDRLETLFAQAVNLVPAGWRVVVGDE